MILHGKNDQFFLWLFIIVGTLVSLTFDIAIILIYYFIIFLSLSFSKYFKKLPLFFFLSFIFLYPRVANNFSAINQKGILLGVTCIVFYLLYRKYNYHWRENKALKRTIFLWVFWGSFAYLITLIAYLAYEIGGINILEFWGQPPLSTSKIMIYITTVPIVFLILVPMVSVNKTNSFKKTFQLYSILVSIVVIIGFLQYYTGITIIDEAYSSQFIKDKRIYSYSLPSPDLLGRVIVFPILLLTNYFIIRIRRRSFIYLLVFIISIVSLLLTFSRATYISVAVGVLFIFLLNIDKVSSLMKSIAVALLIVLVISFLNIPSYFHSTGRLSNPVASLERRLYYQSFGLSILAKNPIFGSLTGRYTELAQDSGIEITGSVHSLYMGTALNFGIPMALIIIFVLIYSFLLGVKVLKQYKKELSLIENSYLNIFLITSTAYSVSMIFHGLSENFNYFLIFLNMGYIFTAKNTLIRQMKTIKLNPI